MKKILLSSLGLIFLTLSINAQQAQSYSGHKSYATMGGRVGGNEQYTYLVDDRGKTIIHGKYTYSGVNHVETNTEKIDAKYAMDLNCKNGFLDGNLTINGNYTSEEFIWTEGWKKASATTKLSGVFKDGKPNGLFSITYQDRMKGAASATLKNGKYIGAYSFQGYITRSSGAFDHQYWYVMKGQLTDDGKLTGQWLYDTQLDTYNYTFINDVLISETHEKYTTPPRVQEIAKKYANKQITKDEVMAQGFYIQEGSIPLNYIVTGYILNEEFNIYEIGAAYDFSDYVEKKFTKIVELNALSKAGFELLKESIDKRDIYDRISTGYYGLNKYNSEVQLCSFVMDYDEEYDAYRLWCDVYFTEQYGTKVTGDGYQDKQIYLTPAQAKEWQTLLENRALKNVVDFESFLKNEELKEAYSHYIDNTLTDWLYTNEHLENLKVELSRYINILDTNATIIEISSYNSYKFTEDHQNIIPVSPDSYYTCAYPNRVDILKEIMSLVNKVNTIRAEYDSIHGVVCEKLRSLTNSDYWYSKMQDRDNNLLSKKQHQDIVYGIITSLDSIQLLNTIVSPLLCSYANIEKIYQQNIKKATFEPDDIESWGTLQNKYNILQNILENIVHMEEYISNRKLVDQLHSEIVTICSTYKGCAKAYKTFSKAYPIIWNTEKDNNIYIKDLLSMLQNIKNTLTDQENLQQIDNALKKAKTLDEIKSAFGIK